MQKALHACPKCHERCYCRWGEDFPDQCTHACEAEEPETDTEGNFSDDEAQYNYED